MTTPLNTYSGPLTLGIDLAKWQGQPPLPELWARGVRFAYCKCVHGAGGVDETFAHNWKSLGAFRGDAGGAGDDDGTGERRYKRGAYAWFVPSADPKAQADRFCSTLEAAGYNDDDLPPALDFEEVDKTLLGTVLRDRFLTFRDCVKKNLGRKVLTYTAPWYFQTTLVNIDCAALAEDDLWNAQYPHLEKVGPVDYDRALQLLQSLTPSIPQPWVAAGKREVMRQFDGDGGLKMPNGVDADFDVFLGSLEMLDLWNRATLINPAPVASGDGGGTFSGGAAHVLGQADDAERAEQERQAAGVLAALDSEPPDTEPGTQEARVRKSGSSSKIRAVRLPEDPSGSNGPSGAD